MGSSGSGKSTLMAILGCLDRPTSGHYLFEGVDVAGLTEPELRADPQRTARLRLPELQSAGAHQRNRKCRVAAVLFGVGPGEPERPKRARTRGAGAVGLGDRERSTPGQLSGGQQQRVAIARALINSPSLLLADEPTGNLDTRTSHEIMETLQCAQSRSGRDDRGRHARAGYRRLCRPRRDDARRQILSDQRTKKPGTAALRPIGCRSCAVAIKASRRDHPPSQALGFCAMIVAQRRKRSSATRCVPP